MTDPIHPAIQSVLDILERSGSDAVLAAMDDSDTQLLTQATELFESFPFASQMSVLAIMFGMLLASIDGEPTQAELESQIFITKQDRLALFLGQANAIYSGAMEMRAHPDCPGLDKRGVM